VPPRVIPSVVKVAPGVGIGIVSLPTIILLRPITTVSPFGSVIVWGLLPRVKVLPSITMSDGEAEGREVGEAFIPPGSSVKVKPSEVKVLTAVTLGNDMVADPTTMPLGPRITVDPSGSVIVSEEAGKLKDEPPIIIPPGTEVCVADVADPVPEAGSKVKVTPSVVIPKGPVAEGKPRVSVPTTIPLGPNTMDWPFGSVIVVGIEGKEKVVPPITISGGVDPVAVPDPGVFEAVPELEGETVSVVPGIVVTEPSGSVDVIGSTVVTD
jgi:hypothetical protein